MTHEELKKAVNDVNEYYRKQIEELESKKKSFVQQLMNDWANENSEFKVGNIIESNMNVIKVTKITCEYSKYDSYFYPVYHGIMLTKQFKPRKDGSTFTIYGDKGRVITKLK